MKPERVERVPYHQRDRLAAEPLAPAVALADRDVEQDAAVVRVERAEGRGSDQAVVIGSADRVRERVGREEARLEEPPDLLVGHGADLEPGETRDLGIAVPAQHVRELFGAVALEVDAASADRVGVPARRVEVEGHRSAMLYHRFHAAVG